MLKITLAFVICSYYNLYMAKVDGTTRIKMSTGSKRPDSMYIIKNLKQYSFQVTLLRATKVTDGHADEAEIITQLEFPSDVSLKRFTDLFNQEVSSRLHVG